MDYNKIKYIIKIIYDTWNIWTIFEFFKISKNYQFF